MMRRWIRIILLSTVPGLCAFSLFNDAAGAHTVDSGWQWTYTNEDEGWCTKAYSGIDHGVAGKGYFEAAVEAWSGCIWPSGTQYERVRLQKVVKSGSTWALCQDLGWKYSSAPQFRTTAFDDNGTATPFCGSAYYRTYAWGQVKWLPPSGWYGNGWLVSGSHYLPASSGGQGPGGGGGGGGC